MKHLRFGEAVSARPHSRVAAAMRKSNFSLFAAVVVLACITAYGGDSATKGVGHSSKAAIKSAKSASQWKAEYDKNLSLSAAMQKALNDYAPGFVAWKQGDYPPKRIAFYPYSVNSLPYAVKGDFNGDGIPDVVLDGHDNDADITVALVSSDTEYRAIGIARHEYYTNARKHGKLVPFTPVAVLVLKTTGEQFQSGDVDIHTIALKHAGFVSKEINMFDFYDTHAFTGHGIDFTLYEFDDVTGKFLQHPLFHVGDDYNIPFDEEF